MSIIVPKPSPTHYVMSFCYRALVASGTWSLCMFSFLFFFFFLMHPAHVRGASDSQLYAMRKCVSMYINICVCDMIYE